MKQRFILSGLFVLFSVIIIFYLYNMINVSEQNERAIVKDSKVFLINDEISALYTMENSLWVGGKDGIKRLNYETGEIIDYVMEDISLIYAAQIVVSSLDNSIWVGHNEGVSVLLENGDRENFTSPSIKGGRVNSILESNEKMYVGSMQGCTVFTLNKGKWEVEKMFDEDSGLANAPVNVIYESSGDIFFGSYLSQNPGGVSVLKNDKVWQHISIAEGLSHPYVNAMIETEERIFVATGQLTAGGLTELNIANGNYYVVDEYSIEDGIPGEKVRQLYIDSNDYVWITTESDGLIIAKSHEEIKHPINGVTLTEENGLSDNEIKCIVETKDYYWLGGRYGLTRLTKQSIDELLNEEGI